MVSKLQIELKQTKPFRSLEEEVILNLARTSEYVSNAMSGLIKASDLTPTQYNVLRILRGAGDDGLSCGEISERMVTKESDITRLLDRLENRNLITRERPANNRRIVIARIADEGLGILAELDQPLDEHVIGLIGHLGRENLETLNELLVEMRSKD
jgi:DNA-binding MarR family transcriptional regulator